MDTLKQSRQRRYRASHKIELAITAQKYLSQHREERKAYSKRYYQNHLNQIAVSRKDYANNHQEERKANYQKHKIQIIQRRRSVDLQQKYGITDEIYNAMLKQQNGSCAICHTPQTALKVRLAVDHNHLTGKVRGLLCIICNSGVVNVIENYSDRIETAKQYLKRGE